jgi:hypothetical protein
MIEHFYSQRHSAERLRYGPLGPYVVQAEHPLQAGIGAITESLGRERLHCLCIRAGSICVRRVRFLKNCSGEREPAIQAPQAGG